MPQKAKARIQADLAAIMETLFSASAALDNDPTSDEEMADQDLDLDNKELDDIAEILLLIGLESMGEVYEMTGDGSWDPYGQITKSEDWSKTALQSPNHDFCCTFRWAITKVCAWSTHWCQSGWAVTHSIGLFAYLLMTWSLNPEVKSHNNMSKYTVTEIMALLRSVLWEILI